MQSLWLIVVVFFLLVLLIPFFFKTHISYDVLNNVGVLSVYIFFIKIIVLKIKLKGKDIILISEKNKKQIETKISKKQMRFLKQLTVQLKQKIIVSRMCAYAKIGVNDAMNSAILSGLFTSLASSIFAYIKNTKKSAKFYVKSEPDYNGSSLIFSIYLSFMITIFDIIYSLVMALTIIKRSEKYERV